MQSDAWLLPDIHNGHEVNWLEYNKEILSSWEVKLAKTLGFQADCLALKEAKC